MLSLEKVESAGRVSSEDSQEASVYRPCTDGASSIKMITLHYSFLKRTEESEIFNMPEPSKPPPPDKKPQKERDPERLPGPASSPEIMDPQIWKEFPEELLEAVIARLPIDTFCRFRSVCKKWNSLPASPSFSQHFAQRPKLQPWFYTVSLDLESLNAGAMYDPGSKKWHPTTIYALPSIFRVGPVASAGGLVCFLHCTRSGVRSFYVGNPLTQSFKELPVGSIDVWGPAAAAMTLNGESTDAGTYSILWLNREGEFEVYDSVRNSWTRSGSIGSTIELPLCLNFQSSAVSIDGTIYFLLRQPDGIVSYDMASGVWEQFEIPAPAHLSDNRTLAKCGGRILLVGLLRERSAKSVCVWELEKMSLLWKEVDRMPSSWSLDLYGKPVKMTCLGNEDVIFLSFRAGREEHFLVTYEVLSREWLKVVEYTPPPGAGVDPQWIACGAAFHPCFTASA